jgi:hypothetical protein
LVLREAGKSATGLSATGAYKKREPVIRNTSTPRRRKLMKCESGRDLIQGLFKAGMRGGRQLQLISLRNPVFSCPRDIAVRRHHVGDHIRVTMRCRGLVGMLQVEAAQSRNLRRQGRSRR